MSRKSLAKRKLRFEAMEGRLLLSASTKLLSLPNAADPAHAKTASSSLVYGPTAPSHSASSSKSAATSTTSSNWAGYAVETSLTSPSADAVSSVSGTWQVPAVASSGRGAAYTAVWVGIDGYSSSTVEQIGTESEIVNGRTVYYAWYEMYPDAMVTLDSVKINPGDTVSASVEYVTTGEHTGTFELTLTDATTNTSATVYQSAAGAERSSAEWIVEAPSSGSSILSLANFTTVAFTNASATVDGTPGPIDDASWAAAKINMVSGTTTKATTSALTDSQATPATSSFTVAYGSATATAVAPSGYSIRADNSTINASQAKSTGFTFKGAQVGATYNYTITSSAGGTAITGTGTVTSATQDVKGIDVSSLPNGTLTFSVTLTNSAGTGKAATAKAILKQVTPSGYTIKADNATINASQAKSTGFTFTGAEVGATYNYTITSSAGGTAITGTGTVTSANQDVKKIDVSSLPNGTLTISVTLTNSVGTGKAATAKAILKQVAPSGYTIKADNATINASQAKSTGFTFKGAEVGATYSYTITSSAGGTAVTGKGTVTSANQDVKGIDVSSLPNGTLTFSVTLTNSVGIGTAATAQAVLNQVAPTGYAIKADDATITTAAKAKSTGFTFTGAEVGAAYTYTITSSGDSNVAQVTGSGTVKSATQDVKGIDVSSLSNGTLTISVTLSNPVGTGTAVTATATLAVVASAPNPTTSTNWSGYAVETDLSDPATGAVTSVSGSWVVPAVSGTGTAYSSVWVGIDGYSSSSVEQIGTDSDIVNGKAEYYAWYEMYPSASVTITTLEIHAGDAVTAQVEYVTTDQYPQGAFELSISDTTTGETYSITLPDEISSGQGQATTKADRSSAEWIVEAPSSTYGVLPLANFGSVTFTDASATINGKTGSIGDSAWAAAAINMVSRSVTEATTSALDSTGSSFSVTYNSSGSVNPTRPQPRWPWWFNALEQPNSMSEAVSALQPSSPLATSNEASVSAWSPSAPLAQPTRGGVASGPAAVAVAAIDSALASLYGDHSGLAGRRFGSSEKGDLGSLDSHLDWSNTSLKGYFA
jgi:large repetitive protein